MASGPITSWQIEVGKVEAVTDFLFLDSKITEDSDFSHEIKMLAPWKESYDNPRHCIKKQRHHLTNKGLYCQSYSFSRSLVWMWELIHKDVLCCAWLLSRVWLFATPWTVPPLSMGFSKQEYWSGLPCPPPRDLPNPGIEPRSPALQVDSLPPEPQGKPKNTGVGGVSLLQGIFLTQKLNWGLLYCRWILYQLNYQRSPLEGWASNNGCFQTVVLEKTSWESLGQQGDQTNQS